MTQDLLAEAEVCTFLAERAREPPTTDATSSRTVFDPTSITPTRIPSILASPRPDPPSFTDRGYASPTARASAARARRCRFT